MTVVRLAAGELFLHSPAELTGTPWYEIVRLGSVRFIAELCPLLVESQSRRMLSPRPRATHHGAGEARPRISSPRSFISM